MSLRTHAVVVNPERWSRPTEELARLLAPITGSEIAPLAELLERGPMTVEADLSPRDARALQQRLAQMGIPAEVEGAETESRPPALPGGLPTEEIPRPPAPPLRQEVITEEISRPPTTGERAAVDPDADDVRPPGAVATEGDPRATDELPRGRQQTMMGMAAADRTPTEGWGALFPDLAADVERAEAAADELKRGEEADGRPESGPQKSAERVIPTLDELESEGEVIPPSLTDAPPPERRTAELDREDPRKRSRTVPGGIASSPPTSSANPTTSGPPEKRAAEPSSPSSKPSPSKPSPSKPAPSPQGTRANDDAAPPPPDPNAIASARKFDGSKLAGLVPTNEDRPPYAPTGFDGRPEHPTQVAAILSALAPGAGQVFNGEDDKALSYGLKFFLIKPWIDAVRDAYQRAEKIRTYWAPRPEPGAFMGAIRYLLAFWLCVGLTGTLLIWGGGKLLEVAKREPEPTIGPRNVASAVEEAEMKMLNARVRGLDAVQEAAMNSEPRGQYTMSDEERAQRLFALGYQQCQARNYAICEAMMKRVATLKNAHRDAIKLQAWASLSRRGGEDAPMPEVGPVKTLTELELQHLRQEMALQGENVPPPPEPKEEPDAGSQIVDVVPDAGTAPEPVEQPGEPEEQPEPEDEKLDPTAVDR